MIKEARKNIKMFFKFPKFSKFRKKDERPFPKSKKFSRLLGPSILILATGLGSGEIVLWPYLGSHYGLGLAWLIVLGIAFQYFINMEIGRYSLVKGESVFMGLNRVFSWSPYWLMFSTFFVFAIPGTAAASAQLIGYLFGIENIKFLGIGFLVLMGLIITSGRTVYKTMEIVTKSMLAVLVPTALAFVIYASSTGDWVSLSKGFVGIGEGYNWIPVGVALTALFGAFAYSGSGGNLNLAISSYIEEKGYGMGKYAPKVKGFFSKKNKKADLTGTPFKKTNKNLENFKSWWWKFSLEHFLVFFLVGLVMIITFFLLSYVTIYPAGIEEEKGVSFIIGQAIAIGEMFFPWMQELFLILVGLILFESQLCIYDSSSRIISENYAIKKSKSGKVDVKLSKFFYLIVWFQVFLGILLFLTGFTDPKFLIILAAVLNALSMLVHIALVNIMNHLTLDKEFRPGILRKGIMIIIFLVFFGFAGITLWSVLF